MQQFLINLADLKALIQEATDANRLLVTIDTPKNGNGNGITKGSPILKVKAVNFLAGGLTDVQVMDATTTSALSLSAPTARELDACPYPPGC